MEHLNGLDIPILESPPNPPGLGKLRIYFKKNGLLYKMDSEGIESNVDLISIGSGFDPTIEMTNNSTINLQAGHIVRLDETTPFSVATFPPFSPYQAYPFGIIKVGGNIGQKVKVQYGGVCDVLMDNAQVNIGDYIYNSATSGLATANDGGFTGALGRALTAKASGSAGKITALINFFAHLG